MKFGDRVSAVINEKRLVQTAIAEAAGIGPVSLNRYLKNTYTPSVTIAGRIAKALGVSLDYLEFGLEEVGGSDDFENNHLHLFKKLSSQEQDLIIEIMEAFIARTELEIIKGE